MTSELRPAVEVATEICGCAYADQRKRDIAAIEADREAVRAEQAAELAKFKALAETLAGALEEIVRDCEADYPPSYGAIKHFARQALTSYKEQRND